MNKHNHYLLALALTRGLGPVTVKNLIAHCGSIEAIFSSSKGKLLKAPGVGPQTLKNLPTSLSLRRAEKELAYCQKNNIQILSYLDEGYPKLLKFIHDAPLLLFKRGQADLNLAPSIAVVGTRRATDYGKELATQFAAFFAQKGINVVSGLAYGIDIAAHRSVLKERGMTTAVLAHGLDSIYPRVHSKKAWEILEKGSLLTEYFTGTKADAPHFPARNRIISGMSKAVVVIEAAEKGGALITARYAFDQNREVYAIPGRLGDEFSQGCNALIRDNVAKLVVGPEEILADLDIQWQQHEQKEEQLRLFLEENEHLNTQEIKVLNVLGKGEQLLDQLLSQTSIPFSKLSAVLLGLEFKGIVKQLPGKRFRRLR